MAEKIARIESTFICSLEAWIFASRLNEKSRMMGDCHVRFCERVG
jgi:hypothetical protein